MFLVHYLNNAFLSFMLKSYVAVNHYYINNKRTMHTDSSVKLNALFLIVKFRVALGGVCGIAIVAVTSKVSCSLLN